MKIFPKLSFSKLLIVIVFVLVTIAVFKKLYPDTYSSLVTGNLDSSKSVVLKGVSLSPISYDSKDFNNYLELTKEVGNTISWQGKITTLDDTNSPARITQSLAEARNLHSVLIISFFNQSTGKFDKKLTQSVKEEYLSLMSNYIKENNPEYFGIGIEINLLRDSNSKDYKLAYAFIDSSLNKLNELYPNTTFFTVFQLEQLKGLKGGMFGGKNNTNDNDWNILDQFKHSEVIGLTTYPSLIYKKPTDIPSDYYSEISKYTDKKIIFTEIGWQSKSVGNDWPNSEKSQDEYINTFFRLIDKENTLGYIWSFLYDQKTIAPFESMGLIDRKSKTKLGYYSWLTK